MKLLFVMLIVVSVIPLTLIIAGYLETYHYPKRNWFVGYRSNMSTKNDETWAYANSECGKKMYKAGIVMLPISILIILLIYLISGDISEMPAMYIDICQIVIMIVLIVITEIDLRKVFNKDGTRKDIL